MTDEQAQRFVRYLLTRHYKSDTLKLRQKYWLLWSCLNARSDTLGTLLKLFTKSQKLLEGGGSAYAPRQGRKWRRQHAALPQLHRAMLKLANQDYREKKLCRRGINAARYYGRNIEWGALLESQLGLG